MNHLVVRVVGVDNVSGNVRRYVVVRGSIRMHQYSLTLGVDLWTSMHGRQRPKLSLVPPFRVVQPQDVIHPCRGQSVIRSHVSKHPSP